MNRSESKYFHTAVRFDRALLSLLERKAFDYITVSELCAEAGVNRSTFYLHYENTRDLLEETTVYLLEDFMSVFPVDGNSLRLRLADCDPGELNFIHSQYLHPYLTYIRDNRRVFSAVLSHPTTFRFESIFQQLFDDFFDPILDRFRYPAEDRKYVLLFYLNGLTAIVREWLMDDCEKSIEEVTGLIRCCIFGKEL